MIELLLKIKDVRTSKTGKLIKKRLHEFMCFESKTEAEWFSELCFCILTANSKAKTGLAIQKELGPKGFLKYPKDKIRACIIKHKHRFHNNKTKYIINARKYTNIKSIIQKIVDYEGEEEAREWLVENIKGLGYKEASHFLRNVGYKNFSILDRHILRLLSDEGIIPEVPRSLSKKKYFEIEHMFTAIAKKTDVTPAELDLILWYMRTGKVLK